MYAIFGHESARSIRTTAAASPSSSSSARTHTTHTTQTARTARTAQTMEAPTPAAHPFSHSYSRLLGASYLYDDSDETQRSSVGQEALHGGSDRAFPSQPRSRHMSVQGPHCRRMSYTQQQMRVHWFSSLQLNTNSLMADEVDVEEDHHMSMPRQCLGRDKVDFITSSCLPLDKRHLQHALAIPSLHRQAQQLHATQVGEARTAATQAATSQRSLPMPTNWQGDSKPAATHTRELRQKGEMYPRRSLEACFKDHEHFDIQRVFEDCKVPSRQSWLSNASSVPSLQWEESCDSGPSVQDQSCGHRRAMHQATHDCGRTRASQAAATSSSASPHDTLWSEAMLDANPVLRGIKILDQQRVLSAANDGRTTVLRCVGCDKFLMTRTDTHLVYCPGCGTLSPLALMQ